MMLEVGKTYTLCTAKKKVLGAIVVDKIEDDLVQGHHEPSDKPTVISDLFKRFDEAVDANALSDLDEIDQEIEDMGIHILNGDAISSELEDVQLYGDGGVGFRLDD